MYQVHHPASFLDLPNVQLLTAYRFVESFSTKWQDKILAGKLGFKAKETCTVQGRGDRSCCTKLEGGGSRKKGEDEERERERE